MWGMLASALGGGAMDKAVSLSCRHGCCGRPSLHAAAAVVSVCPVASRDSSLALSTFSEAHVTLLPACDLCLPTRQVDLDTVLTEAAQHGASIDTICIQFPVSRHSRVLPGCPCVCVPTWLVCECETYKDPCRWRVSSFVVLRQRSLVQASLVYNARLR